jgi:hypothetical protein
LKKGHAVCPEKGGRNGKFVASDCWQTEDFCQAAAVGPAVLFGSWAEFQFFPTTSSLAMARTPEMSII